MGMLADRLAAMDRERRSYTLQTLPTHLAESRQDGRLRALLTAFEFVLAKITAGLIDGLVEDYRIAGAALPGDAALGEWDGSLRERLHMLSQGGADWPPERVLVQLAAEHADASPITEAAEAWLAGGGWDGLWLRRASRPAHVPPRALLASIPVGDMVLDMVVDAAGTQAVVLTAVIGVDNTVYGAALWRVDLQTLQTQPQPAALEVRWGMRLPDGAALFEPAPSARPWSNPDAAPRRDERLAALAWRRVAYSADADMSAPIYFLEGGQRLVTGTHDGVVRIWDADALEASAAGERGGDPAARAALDEARRTWTVQDSMMEMPTLESGKRDTGVTLDTMHNVAHNTTLLNWGALHRDLDTLRFRFDTPHRLELWRRGASHPLACWISDVPLIQAQYDNVLVDSRLAIRAVRMGSGLAVETTAGDAFLIEAWQGNQRIDLAVLDQEGV